ncbi:MAG TPA: ATP-binding protein [Terriglobia bacterium]|nr:ATP-binding protein [Terriglobia bacterium]
MEQIAKEDIIRRIRVENPWWEGNHTIGRIHQAMKPRAYLDLFFSLVTLEPVHRALVLLGPRRVGKTVMILHTIQKLLDTGVPPHAVCYFSVDHPIYNGLGLEKLLEYYLLATASDSAASTTRYIFFDEIQYLRNWEVHLKSFVDSHAGIRSIASGSAAAALRLKSTESGAGRFTDFLLPPLTFYEYLELLNETDLLENPVAAPPPRVFFEAREIETLNQRFLHYLNFGGYPEVALSPEIQADPARFIRNDIIDKVLLRDLPSLYGILDIQELNYLFTSLAFNTANEVSLEELSQNSGVAKNTIKRYIEYLEAAFLVRVVHRLDRNARRFKRANFFKVHLTNPSMRAALFSPLSADDAAVGPLAETAIWSQWFHGDSVLYYARWQGGEVDMVQLHPNQKPAWAVEVKWSDRYCEHPEELKSVISFCRKNGLHSVLVTSRTQAAVKSLEGLAIHFVPTSVYCYTVGHNLIQGKSNLHPVAPA